LLTEDDYLAKVEEYGDDFYAAMGAEGIRELLRSIDLAREVETLRSRTGDDHFGNQEQEVLQAPEDPGGLSEVGHQARVDGA
jgi:hypothetical protein